MAGITIPRGLRIIWHCLGSIHLTVALCLLLAANLALGYLCLKAHNGLFAPLNDIGLWAWLQTYGRYNLAHTAWFFILLGLLALLCVNSFVCTTERVAGLVSRGAHQGLRRLFFRLAPHLMHYALILILAGYLCSYLFSRVLDTRILVPGVPMTLPATAVQIDFTAFDPVYYQGRGLPAFEHRVLQPRARLLVINGKQREEKMLSLNRPVWAAGYGIFLKDFSPRMKGGGMGGRPRIDVSIRKDPGVNLYLAGIAIFTAGLAVYLVEWVFFKKVGNRSGAGPTQKYLRPQ